MPSGIYKIKNLINGNIYIGSAVNINKRFVNHISSLKTGKHDNQHLQRAWLKYRADAFEFSIIEECDIPSLIKREQHYIDTLSPQYNICRIAGSLLGYKHSAEARAKIGEANKNRSDEYHAKIGEANKRRIVSAETRAKMSASQKGIKKPHSIEHRAKISALKK